MVSLHHPFYFDVGEGIGHALKKVGDLLRAARPAEGEQGDIDEALGHGGVPLRWVRRTGDAPRRPGT